MSEREELLEIIKDYKDKLREVYEKLEHSHEVIEREYLEKAAIQKKIQELEEKTYSGNIFYVEKDVVLDQSLCSVIEENDQNTLLKNYLCKEADIAVEKLQLKNPSKIYSRVSDPYRVLEVPSYNGNSKTLLYRFNVVVTESSNDSLKRLPESFDYSSSYFLPKTNISYKAL